MHAKRKTAVLLISCYELGHQPAGLASPMAFLQRAGFEVETLDVSVEGFDEEKVRAAGLIGISVPMHTALRLGARVAERARRLNAGAHICFYGLYASLNAGYLLDTVADSVIGGEFEAPLVGLAEALEAGARIEVEGVATRSRSALPVLARLPFAVADRRRLAPLERYARLDLGGEQRLAGYVEASRGCLHMCTHCPIPPVYNGRFFAVPRETVLADIRNLVAAGARHITFGDPDFLNGPTHSLRLVRAMHAEFRDLTFDFTAKVEHLLKHRELLPEMARLGCVFVVSAVESLSEEVLRRLAKGHTRADVEEAFGVAEQAGVALRPSFVSFTPWTTLDDYLDVLEFVAERRLIDHVDAVQYAIRLLVPPGSLLLEQPDAGEWLGRLAQDSFTYEWRHPDPRMDELHRQVSALVEQAAARNEDNAATFARVRQAAFAMRGASAPALSPLSPLRRRVPKLTEAWFC